MVESYMSSLNRIRYLLLSLVVRKVNCYGDTVSASTYRERRKRPLIVKTTTGLIIARDDDRHLTLGS